MFLHDSKSVLKYLVKTSLDGRCVCMRYNLTWARMNKHTEYGVLLAARAKLLLQCFGVLYLLPEELSVMSVCQVCQVCQCVCVSVCQCVSVSVCLCLCVCVS